MNPFPMVEMALKEVIESYAPANGKVGGDLSYDGVADLYVWIGLITGSTTQIDGDWTVDIDCFAKTYKTAMDHALDLEALLLTPGGHRTSIMRLDSASQNESPVERPWGDDSVFRVGATYVFTARRSG